MKAEWTNKDSLSIESTGQIAILVLDMPRSCAECKLKYLDTGDDAYWGANVERCIWDNCEIEHNERAYDCPLRPLPSQKYLSLRDKHDDIIFQMGWNGCLDEILGETE